MAYKVEVEEVGKYIAYLNSFKKTLEKKLHEFDKIIKDAHRFWDDNNYQQTLAVEKTIATEQMKLIDAINVASKKLNQMHEEYSKYLRKKL